MLMQDKVAVVTGSGSGIGKGIVLKLSGEGARVVVNDVVEEKGEQVAAEIKDKGGEAVFIGGNVASIKEMETLMEETSAKFGRIDILVNNAGIFRDNLLKNLSEEDWDSVMDVDLKGVFSCSKAASKHMMEQNYGKIVNISSVAYLGNAGQANYAAAKGGVVSLTWTLALELARYNINVNCIAPGFIETPLVRTMPEKFQERLIAKIPFRRIGQPSDIANLVAFLASEDASYLTGQIIHCCGGMSVGL